MDQELKRRLENIFQMTATIEDQISYVVSKGITEEEFDQFIEENGEEHGSVVGHLKEEFLRQLHRTIRR